MSNISRRQFFSVPLTESSDPLVHFASLLVQATPAGCAAVREAVERIPAAEVHDTGQVGKLAVVLESADGRAIADAFNELQQLTGVLTVSIVAHLTEHESLLDAPE
jgi:periplasmic nitrate reductase NapD